MLLVLDNYDSFTYNLVQYAAALGADPVIHRSDRIGVADALALEPAAIIISPGPGTPERAGISVGLVRAAAGRMPILGVCLGHQAIAVAFGGTVGRAERVMHGKTTPVAHRGTDLFAGLPSPFPAMRYHSLVADAGTLPPALEATAWAADRPIGAEIMGLRHREFPIFGVQFHPESIGTAHGHALLANFLAQVPASGAGVCS